MSQIPGVPLGAKIVRVALLTDPVRPGECLLQSNGEIGPNILGQVGVVVAPDNPYGRFLHEVEVDIKAAGRERLGGDDYRDTKDGEEYWGLDGNVYLEDRQTQFAAVKRRNDSRFILKPRKRRVLVVECEEPWHTGTPADIAVVFHGQRVAVMSHRIEERGL